MYIRLIGSDKVVKMDKNSFLVGRSSKCELTLAHEEVSRRHCLLTCVDNIWYATDVNSLNGVQVNGYKLPVMTPTEVYPGDIIKVGDYHLCLEECLLSFMVSSLMKQTA